MKSPALRWLTVVLVNLAILASIELISALIIRKRFKKSNALYWHGLEVEQPFAILTGWQMKPNATIGDSRPTCIRTDADGHAMVPDPLPHPRYTLAVLGGSTMFGVGVAHNSSNVPSQLQTLLRNEYGLEVNVVNLGVRGYCSVQELLMLNQYLAEHPLDMVVSVSGHNDLRRYINKEPHPSYIKCRNSEAELLVRRVEAGNLVISNFVPALRRVSQTANLAALVLGRVPPVAHQEETNTAKVVPNQRGTDARVAGSNSHSRSDSTFLTAHLANYAMMNAVCDVHHTYFKLYFQPNAFSKAKLSPEEKSRLLNKDFSGSQAKFDTCALSERSYRAAFSLAAKSFSYSDLADAFGEIDAQVYLDSCHFNERGAALLARKLADDLAPIIKARLVGDSGDGAQDAINSKSVETNASANTIASPEGNPIH